MGALIAFDCFPRVKFTTRICKKDRMSTPSIFCSLILAVLSLVSSVFTQEYIKKVVYTFLRIGNLKKNVLFLFGCIGISVAALQYVDSVALGHVGS